MKHALIFKLYILYLITPGLKAMTVFANPDSAAFVNQYIHERERYKIHLLRNNTIIDSVIVERHKPFCFFLKKDGQYAIQISREGYLPRLMQLNTIFSDRKPNHCYFKFQVNATLKEKNDPPIDQFSATLVSYDEKKGGFYYED
jgi:hypothetical protein